MATTPPTIDITRAADLLRDGKLVAFPTETVYGLGADATSDAAVKNIFAAKGRPANNPLIVHVFDIESAKRCVTNWPPAADALAKQFWPGPLTLVLPKAACIANVVTAGGSTVGVRVPNHPLALELLRMVDRPIAAPSANSSERISPTTALHVRLDLGDKVDLVLDGGPCTVGIESTVLDLSVAPPMILRPGGITREQIESIIGPVNLPMSMTEPNAKSPGRATRHYAPRTPAYRFEAGTMRAVPAGAVSMSVHPSTATMPSDPEQFAATLYDTLRQLDGAGASAIYIELPPDEPRWLAVRDRLMRAAKPIGGDDVACPMCSYSLRGLAEPRCPECGFAFDWAELLDPVRQKHPYLFEHHAERNVWSFFKTQFGGWKPKEFWTSLHPAQPSNLRRLSVYALICAALCLATLAFAFGRLILSLSLAPQGRLVSHWSYYFKRLARTEPVSTTIVCLVWPLLTLIGLQIFRWSMRRARVNGIHAARCIIYSADSLLVIGIVSGITEVAYQFIDFRSASSIDFTFALTRVCGWLTIAFIGFFIIRLIFAYRSYLRFDRAILTVLASQAIAGLAWWKIYLMLQGY